MLFTRAFIISALTVLATADNTTPAAALPTSITGVSGGQITNAFNDIAKFLSTKTLDPAYVAAEAAITSAIPASALSQIGADSSGWIQSIVTGTVTPDWYSAVPSSALSVLSSMASEELSIVSKDVTGPAPTNGVKIAGAALAAGAAALAVL